MRSKRRLKEHAWYYLYFAGAVLLIMMIALISYKPIDNRIKIGFVNDDKVYTQAFNEAFEKSLIELGYYFESIEIISYSSDQEALTALKNKEISIIQVDALAYVDDLDASFSVIGAHNDWLNFNGEEVYFTAYYNTILLAKTNERTQALMNKKSLSFDDYNSLSYCVQKASSLTGYLAFESYLNQTFNKHIYDLNKTASFKDYASALSDLSEDKCDCMVGYQNVREDYEEYFSLINEDYTVYDETFVLKKMDNIYTNAILVNTDLISFPQRQLLQNVLAKLEFFDETSINSFTILSNEDFEALYQIKHSLSSKK